MQKKALAAVLLSFAVSLAHAAPSIAPEADDMDSLLAQKGLMVHLRQVRNSVTERASDLVINAMGFIGVPYRRGGSSENGVDCSGFVRTIYEQTFGLLLPHRANEQAAVTQKIERSELKPGDLVFFNTMRRTFSHVGVYLGDNKFIHAPRPGAKVRVEDMGMSYWNNRFDGARRVEGAEDAAAIAAVANLPATR
jgi:cell wall-associated NlpC family hydrolase